MIKMQQRFRSERHIVFTEETNKIALSANDDKRIQSIDQQKHMQLGQAKIQHVRIEKSNVTI